MNKLLTNEGGQPVYLDDLQLLQSTSWDLMKGLLVSLAGTESGFLLSPLEFSTSIGADATLDDRLYATIDGVSVTIFGNSIVHDGNIIPFASATFLNTDIANGGGIKVGIRIADSDGRTCSDGNVRACRRTYTAFLYVGSASVSASYSLYDLECLEEIVSRRAGFVPADTRWKQMPIVFYNGYCGSVRYTEGSAPRLRLNVRSSATSWRANDAGYENDDNDAQYTGLIGILLDSSLRASFVLKASENSTTNLLRPDGSRFSQVKTTNPRGKIVIQSLGSYTDGNGVTQTVSLTRGYLPPCLPGDEYGQVIACLDRDV